MGRGDVEEDDLVGAFAGVARGQLGGIAGVDDVDELDALDDAAVADVETGDDALGQHGRNSRKLRRICRPVSPDFSGMELHAHDVVALDGGGEGLDVVVRRRRCPR